MKVEAPPETVDKALADIAQRNRDARADRAGGAGRPRRGEGRGADGRLCRAGSTARSSPAAPATDIEVEIGGAGFIPGFSEQLEGMKPGETRTIEVTFPAEYGAPDLAGKAASFEVTAQALQPRGRAGAGRRVGQEAGVRRPGGDARDGHASGIQAEYDQLARLRLKRQLLDALAERGQVRLARRAWWSRSSTRSGSAWRRTARPGGWTTTTRTRTRRR